jgi:uncharacterized protein
MVDVTSNVPSGRQVVEAYGGGGFRVSGTAYRGSVLVTPGASFPWPVAGFDALAPESFQPFLTVLAEIEILLLGCGAKLLPVSKTLRAAVRAAGPVLEPMDTGAACRTYNVLLAEDRRVAAALIAVE